MSIFQSFYKVRSQLVHVCESLSLSSYPTKNTIKMLIHTWEWTRNEDRHMTKNPASWKELSSNRRCFELFNFLTTWKTFKKDLKELWEQKPTIFKHIGRYLYLSQLTLFFLKKQQMLSKQSILNPGKGFPSIWPRFQMIGSLFTQLHYLLIEIRHYLSQTKAC
jgi:hypothetical protein